MLTDHPSPALPLVEASTGTSSVYQVGNNQLWLSVMLKWDNAGLPSQMQNILTRTVQCSAGQQLGDKASLQPAKQQGCCTMDCITNRYMKSHQRTAFAEHAYSITQYYSITQTTPFRALSCICRKGPNRQDQAASQLKLIIPEPTTAGSITGAAACVFLQTLVLQAASNSQTHSG